MRRMLDTLDLSLPVEVKTASSEASVVNIRVVVTRKEDAFNIQVSSLADVFFDWVCVLDEGGFGQLQLVAAFGEFIRIFSTMLANCIRDPNAYAAMIVPSEGGMTLHIVNRIGDYRIVELLELPLSPGASSPEGERRRVQAKFEELQARFVVLCFPSSLVTFCCWGRKKATKQLD